MTKRRVWDLSRILQHCRVTELVDVSDFDSDAAKLGGSSPSSVAICRIYLHTAGKKEEKAEFESARESLLIKTVTSVRRNTVTFLRVFR